MADRAIQEKIVESAMVLVRGADLDREMRDRKMFGVVIYDHNIEDTYCVSMSSTKDFINGLKVFVDKEERDLVVRQAINGMKADKNIVPIFYKSTKRFSWGDGISTDVGFFMLTRGNK